MSLPNSSTQLAVGEEKRGDCRRASEAALALLKAGIRPRDILTRKAFENAITVVIALGGSTNAVLHLLAIAHSGRRPALDRRLHADRQAGPGPGRPEAVREVRRLPPRADRGPAAPDEDAPRQGAAARRLHHGHGKDRRREPAAAWGPTPPTRTSSARSRTPSRRTATCAILYGNLAPGGAVAKITGKEGLRFSGRAIVFESEEAALAAILDGRVRAGHVIVIRNEGPVGGPGMREMLAPTSAVVGKGLGSAVGAHHRRPILRGQPRLRRRPHHARRPPWAARSPSFATGTRSRSTRSPTRSRSASPRRSSGPG